jgi:5'-3' exonuclease
MRLFLVDSSIFVFRAWFGPQPERVNVHQQPNQAFVGFSDFVYRLLTVRKTIYPEYKANRSPAPAELKRQFAWCRQWLEARWVSAASAVIVGKPTT